MTDIRIFFRLLIGMVIASVGAIAITIFLLYQQSLHTRENFLLGVADRYRHAIVSTYRQIELHAIEAHPKRYANDKQYAFKAVSKVIYDAMGHNIDSGDVGIVVGYMAPDGWIRFISTTDKDKKTDPVTMGSDKSIPMQWALQGKTGTMRLKDHSGRMVIAAYTQAKPLKIGVVTKSLVADINRSYLVGASLAALPALVMLVFGTTYFWILVSRMIDRLKEDAFYYQRIAKERDESEKRYRFLFENMSEALAMCELFFEDDRVVDFKVITVNKAYSEVTGRKDEEVKGKMGSKVSSRPEDLIALLDRLYREKQSFRIEEYWPALERWFDVSFVMASPTVAALIFSNQTERIELARQHRQTSKLEAIGNFAAGIAHDFNNALQPIMGNCELLQIKLKDVSARRNVKGILDAAETAHLLVKRIQSFTRKEQEPEATIPLKIDACIKESFEFLRSITPTTIDMEMNVDENLGLVSATDVIIRQILMNLVKNAAQAIGDEPGQINIDVTNEDILIERWNLKPGKYIKIEVEDNGCGMPEEVLDRALDPYYTTKGEDGSGLGLAVIQGILKSHKGLIHLQSTEDLGTKVDVYLPVLEGANGTEDACKIDEPIPMGAGQHIMFVDDEKIIVRVGQKMLESLNYRVTCFDRSVEALREFELFSANYDVLTTDLTMPVISGIRLIEEAKKIKPDIKVILTSGLGMNGKNRANGYSNLIDAYLQKPVTRRQYGEILADLFKG